MSAITSKTVRHNISSSINGFHVKIVAEDRKVSSIKLGMSIGNDRRVIDLPCDSGYLDALYDLYDTIGEALAEARSNNLLLRAPLDASAAKGNPQKESNDGH